MKVKDLDTLKEVFEFKVMPLLEEYFFDEWSNIKKVLNDSGDIFYKKTPIQDYLKVGDGNDELYEKCDFNDDSINFLDAFKRVYENNSNNEQDTSTTSEV